MKSLAETFEEILFDKWELASDYNLLGYDDPPKIIEELLQAVKERDRYVVGEDEPEPEEVPNPILQADEYWEGLANNVRNIFRKEIRQCQQETL